MKITDKEYVLRHLPKRLSHQNKGDFGHVLVIGGSVGMCGSVCMTAESAIKAGAGLVTVCVPQEISEVVMTKLTECMVLPAKSKNGVFSSEATEKISEFLPKVNTVVFGMGVRVCQGGLEILKLLFSSFSGNLILDADGLNILAQNMELINRKNCKVIVTPHPGEMSRLVNQPISEIQVTRNENALSFSKEFGLVTVLKGEKTVISDGKDVFVNPTGNVGMATAGSGDVLAGIIGGLSAQGLSSFESSVIGTYLHGLSGDIAEQDKTVYCLKATDIIEYLPRAFKKVMYE